MRRPWRIADTIGVKSSCSSTSAATSRATSAPCRPIAMPTCAAFSAGASFTPSPVIATMRPPRSSAATRRSFCSGRTRANTSARASAASSAASLIAAISSPVTTAAAPMPTSPATARAVDG